MKCPLCNSDRVYLAHEFGDKVGDGLYTHNCEACGAKRINGKWTKKCERCGKIVNALHGLFVPHLCKSCLDIVVENDRKIGNVCLMCRQPRSLCCC